MRLNWIQNILNLKANRFDDRLNHLLDDELGPNKRQALLDEINADPAKKDKYDYQRALRASLMNLPRQAPPKRVWTNIEAAIEDRQPDNVWLPWFYTTQGSTFARACSVLVFGAAMYSMIVMAMPSKPAYHIIAINDINGYANEADAYLAHHDLHGEPMATRESLVAYYTYGQSE